MRVGIAAQITVYDYENHENYLVMGRRGKDPNRGLFVLPGGGVKDGETLEQAVKREVLEETGLDFKPYYGTFQNPRIIELVSEEEHRLVIIVKGKADLKDLVGGTDLYDVRYFSWDEDLPSDTSPVIKPLLEEYGFTFKI